MKLALTHISFRAIAEGSNKIAIVLEQPGTLASPRTLSAQDPSQPKIPVNPRSQSAQDSSQTKIPVNLRSQSALDVLMPIWLMPVWSLAHAYLIFGSCLFDIWLLPI